MKKAVFGFGKRTAGPFLIEVLKSALGFLTFFSCPSRCNRVNVVSFPAGKRHMRMPIDTEDVPRDPKPHSPGTYV